MQSQSLLLLTLMGADGELWGKALKPLPAPLKPKSKPVTPKGTVRQEEYERRQFQKAFKK